MLICSCEGKILRKVPRVYFLTHLSSGYIAENL